jgi:hypothetical protein
MKVLYRNDRPKILNLLDEQALRCWRARKTTSITGNCIVKRATHLSHCKLEIYFLSYLGNPLRNLISSKTKPNLLHTHAALCLTCTCQGLNPCERMESKNSARRWAPSPANRSCTFFLKKGNRTASWVLLRSCSILETAVSRGCIEARPNWTSQDHLFNNSRLADSLAFGVPIMPSCKSLPIAKLILSEAINRVQALTLMYLVK